MSNDLASMIHPPRPSPDSIGLWRIVRGYETLWMTCPSDKVPAELYGEIAWNIRSGDMDGWRLDGSAHQHLAWIAAFRANSEQKPSDFPPVPAASNT